MGSLEDTIGEVEKDCQAGRREGILHHREGQYPCWDVAQVRRASAAIPWRTVRFTRSIKAVFNRPERPHPCKAALRAGSVPRRITCVTRTSLRQRSAFLHLAVDQAWLHQPSTHVASSTTHMEPLAKVGRERIKVQIEPITGKERQTARGQPLSQRVDEQVRHVLCARTQIKYGKKRACKGRWPARARAPGWRSGAWFAVHPAGDAGGADGRRSVRARSVHVSLPESARW
jgi:hypothetical protein